jgi:16S rRNA (uracil1498-N3)-methyltransferase
VLPRFFAPDATRHADDMLVRLPDEESKHLLRVLRLKVGAQVFVFDGEGHEWRGEVAPASDRKAAVVRLMAPVISAREPAVRIGLALAVLKGDKMDDVVRDAVMMGVTSIQPLVTDRTEVGFGAVNRSNRRERWHRIAVASAKQCGRAVVPSIAAPARFEEWSASVSPRETLMLVEPATALDVQRLKDLDCRSGATLVVGPEGGWSENELDVARSRNATLLTLGGITLRADAMAIVALTALRTVWGDL